MWPAASIVSVNTLVAHGNNMSSPSTNLMSSPVEASKPLLLATAGPLLSCSIISTRPGNVSLTCLSTLALSSVEPSSTKINSLSKKYNLKIIEDAAHATGASYKNKKIGSHSMGVCFSFHPIKNLAMPTGGLISINDKNHEKIRELLSARRWCGITDRKNTLYDVKEIGNNYYMNELSAAIGLTQLKKLDKLNSIRKKIAKRYYQEIKLNTKMQYDKNCSYHLYWILVKNRNEFRKKLSRHKIETGTHYKPVHTFSLYKSKAKLKITENVGKSIVTIPCHPNLKESDIDKIIKSINLLDSHFF